MICEKCGAPMNDDAKFCPSCGAVPTDADAPVTVPEEVAVPDTDATVAVPEEAAAPDADATVAVPEDTAAPDADATVALPEDAAVPDADDAVAVPEDATASATTGSRRGARAAVIVVLVAAIALVMWKVVWPRFNSTKDAASTSESSLSKREPAKYPVLADIAKNITVSRYSVRHILIENTAEDAAGDVNVTSLNLENAADVTIDSTVTADTARDRNAYKLAQSVLQQYLDGDHTAEAFGALAEKFSKDPGSASSGGLYEDVERGVMVEPFEAWCVAPNRVAGDVGIIESDLGYHVMYFVKSTYSSQDILDVISKVDPQSLAVTEAEYQYYYMNTYYLIRDQLSYYGYNYGIEYDYSAMPDAQPYTGEAIFGPLEGFEAGEATWADLIEYLANENLRMIKASEVLANGLGITLDDDDHKQIETQMARVHSLAQSNSQTDDAYLQEGFGDVMTTDTFRTILESQQLYLKLLSETQNALGNAYSDEEINAAFDANIFAYGVVSYRVYSLPNGARDWAIRLSGAKSEEEFVQIAAEADKALRSNDEDADILGDDSLTLQRDVPLNEIYDNSFTTWVKNGNAIPGATTLTGNVSSGYKAYYITEGLHHPADQPFYSVRHILITFTSMPGTDAQAQEDATATDTQPASEEPTNGTTQDSTQVPAPDLSNAGDVTVDNTADTETLTDATAYSTAVNVLQRYLDGEHTADAFAALAMQFSEDGNASTGGLYENIPVGQMVEPFESWCLADGRKQGDVGIVETNYGYHVMYFEGRSFTTWMDTVRDALATADAAKFSNTLRTVGVDLVNLPQEVLTKATDVSFALIRSQLEKAAATSEQ